MPLPRAALFLAVLSLILAGCGESTPPDNRAADVKAVKDLETQWNKDFAAKDVDKLAAHYTPDAVVMTPGAAAASTDDARKALIREVVNDPAGSLSFESTSVEAARSGDIAWSRGTYTMTMTNPATNKPMTDHGSYVTVYKKQPDGMWKAVEDINVSEVPPPAAKKPARKAAATKKKRR